MDTIASVSYSRVRGLVLTSARGHRITFDEDVAGFMLAYSPDTPSKLPEVCAPWRPVVEACSTWCRWQQAKEAEEVKRQLQAELAQNLAHDGFDGAWTAVDWAETCAATGYLADGIRFVVPMHLPTDYDVPEYESRS